MHTAKVKCAEMWLAIKPCWHLERKRTDVPWYWWYQLIYLSLDIDINSIYQVGQTRTNSLIGSWLLWCSPIGRWCCAAHKCHFLNIFKIITMLHSSGETSQTAQSITVCLGTTLLSSHSNNGYISGILQLKTISFDHLLSNRRHSWAWYWCQQQRP